MTTPSDPDNVIKISEAEDSLTQSNNSQNLVSNSNSNGPGNVPEEIFPTVRGYHVMAIVLCCLVLAAIVMCCVTWRLRYKIVLRVKDPTKHNTTVVQNLLALTVQRGGRPNERKYYEPRDPMRLESWEPEPSLQTRVQGAKAGEKARRKQTRGQRLNISFKSRRRSTGEIIGAGTNSGRPRAKSVVNNIAGYKRFSRLKSIKLSSGLTVPTEVDTRILPDLENLPGSSHPLNLSGYGTS